MSEDGPTILNIDEDTEREAFEYIVKHYKEEGIAAVMYITNKKLHENRDAMAELLEEIDALQETMAKVIIEADALGKYVAAISKTVEEIAKAIKLMSKNFGKTDNGDKVIH